MLRTGAQLYPEATHIASYQARSHATPRPVAFGVVAAAAGLTPADAALVALYDDAATVASAAVKLLPIDAGVATGWIAQRAGELATLAHSAADAQELPSLCAPLVELRSLAHGHDRGRLFAS